MENITKMKKNEVINKQNTPRECGVLTCLHNTADTCTIKTCEIFERTLIQEY